MEADCRVPIETEKPSSSKATGKVKAEQPPTKSNPRSRRETATPVRNHQESVEPEGSVTGSGRRPKRTIKPPRKYEDEGCLPELFLNPFLDPYTLKVSHYFVVHRAKTR